MDPLKGFGGELGHEGEEVQPGRRMAARLDPTLTIWNNLETP